MNNLMLDYSQFLNDNDITNIDSTNDNTTSITLKEFITSLFTTDKIKRRHRKATKKPYNKVKSINRKKNKLARKSRRRNRK